MKYESKLIKELKEKLKKSEDSDLISIVNEFWVNSEKNYPIIEQLDGDEHLTNHELVTFLFRSSKELDNVFLLAEFNYVDPRDLIFDKIDKTNIYYKTIPLVKDAQAEYRIIENDPLDGIFAGAKYENRWPNKFMEHPDRLNKNIKVIKDKFGENQDLLIAPLRSPSAENRKLLGDQGQPRGEHYTFEFASEILGYARKITVYTPVNYDSTIQYPFLYVHDGSSFLQYNEFNFFLDNLIVSGQIPPIVAIFADPGMKNGQTMRYDEYPCKPEFARSITEEILPFIREKFSISSNPREGIIAGSSYGGLAAFYYSFMYTNMITNVLSLSGSFHWGQPEDDYPNEWLPRQVAFSDPKPINVFLEVGKLEGEYNFTSPDWPNQIVSHRHFTTILKMKGYQYKYNEYPGDHSHSAWIIPFKRGLKYFLCDSTED
ncbi:MAG: alpha/beta hydrolase-fold protein [Candidatus Kariarchaeaceae archaeon]|jgi:enterochelin esterase family protein